MSFLLETTRRTSKSSVIKSTQSYNLPHEIQILGYYPRYVDPGLTLALSKKASRVGVSSTHLRMETELVSETLCSLLL
jgi:hypothetical protein